MVVSADELVAAEVAKESMLGLKVMWRGVHVPEIMMCQAQIFLNSGDKIPDSIVVPIVLDRLKQNDALQHVCASCFHWLGDRHRGG